MTHQRTLTSALCVSLRVAYDYRSTQGSGRNLSQSRLVCALVLAGNAP
jgi:hypothetical protein